VFEISIHTYVTAQLKFLLHKFVSLTLLFNTYSTQSTGTIKTLRVHFRIWNNLG